VTKDNSNCFLFGKKTPPPEKTKDLILESAKKHFCEKGFEGTSVRNICCEVGANVSAIKYHFGDKEGLYRECFIKYGQDRLSMAAKILSKPTSIEDLQLRLKLFAEEFIKDGLSDIHTTKMVCREIENENPLIQDIFQETFLKVYETLVVIFVDAQHSGIIRKDTDPLMMASFFFHSLTQTLRMDHIAEKYFQKSLKNTEHRDLFIKNTISVLFDGIKIQEP
jgi:AcrR family transcriptional regulator